MRGDDERASRLMPLMPRPMPMPIDDAAFTTMMMPR